VDARTRKLAGLAIAAVGIVLAIVGGLADQVGIGANDDGEMGGKQIAALIVGLLLVAGGIVLATVLAKDAGGDAGTDEGAGAVGAGESDPTPAAGTPVTEAAEPSVEDEPSAEVEVEPEPVEAADGGD
jgi:hypothetical protein